VSASKDGSEPLSTALAVIAEDSGMAMAGLIGNEIKFEAEDFARALNVSKISAIEITDVPDVGAGELRVGSTVINSGARISASSLEKMTYTASSRESTRTKVSLKMRSLQECREAISKRRERLKRIFLSTLRIFSANLMRFGANNAKIKSY
jgi:hypothetical protein